MGYLNKCYANVRIGLFQSSTVGQTYKNYHMIHKENYQLIKYKNSNQEERDTGLTAVRINMSYSFNFDSSIIYLCIYGRIPAYSQPSTHHLLTQSSPVLTSNYKLSGHFEMRL